MNILKLIGRTAPLFDDDISTFKKELETLVSNSSFLVIGGAGSIGSEIVRQVAGFNPKLVIILVR